MIEIKCNEVFKRNFSNLFDYNINRCDKCYTLTTSYIGFKEILHFTTNDIVLLIKTLNDLSLKNTIYYIVKDEFLYNDLEIYEYLETERIIIIEEVLCNFKSS